MNNLKPAEQLAFEQVVANTDQLLWKAYDASVNGTHWPEVRLRFPTYRTEDLKVKARHRVSEQEARFAMTGELAKSSLLYAVEAPTQERYQFTGKTAISGKTDVAIYWPNGDRMWNVEFKAKGFSGDRSLKSSIQKDIEKLLREELDGFWFHTLKSVDNTTLKTVWDAFAADLRQVAKRLADARILIPAKGFVFHVCVLSQGFSAEVRLRITQDVLTEDWLKGVQAPVLPSRQAGNPFSDECGWTIRSHSQASQPLE